MPRENEKGEECELGVQSRNDRGKGAWLFPYVAVVLDVTLEFGPERARWGGRERGGAGPGRAEALWGR